MKFAYLDESGYGDEPVFVIVGIVVDASRMHLIKDVWSEVLEILSDISGKEIQEFHTRRFYRGRGPWYGMDGNVRANIVTALLNILKERKHSLTFSGIDKALFEDLQQEDDRLRELGSYWCAGAFHVALTLQREHQNLKNNKGHTVIICDRESREEGQYHELIRNPPDWSDEYYDRKKKKSRLDQIVDVPYFADSEHVLLIQLADLVAYLLRRYAEVVGGYVEPDYDDEVDRLTKWVEQIGEISGSSSHRYLKRGRTDTADLFWTLAPDVIRQIG